MIKTFEQFVNEMYSPINEAFQSSKLREIIKQHGKPKYSWDNKMLYDLQDNEIVDVVSNRDEYWKKYGDRKNGEQETFLLELKDGACVVISNLNIFKAFNDKFGEKARKEIDILFKKKHAERHVGNLGNTGDEIHKQHLQKVDEIERRRLVEKLQPHIQEIVDKVKLELEDIDVDDLDSESGVGEINEIEFSLIGETCLMDIYYNFNWSDSIHSYGVEYRDLTVSLERFEIYFEDLDIYVTNEDLGITYETYKNLFTDIEYKDEECGIYDYYEAYGVDQSDFI